MGSQFWRPQILTDWPLLRDQTAAGTRGAGLPRLLPSPESKGAWGWGSCDPLQRQNRWPKNPPIRPHLLKFPKVILWGPNLEHTGRCGGGELDAEAAEERSSLNKEHPRAMCCSRALTQKCLSWQLIRSDRDLRTQLSGSKKLPFASVSSPVIWTCSSAGPRVGVELQSEWLAPPE